MQIKQHLNNICLRDISFTTLLKQNQMVFWGIQIRNFG